MAARQNRVKRNVKKRPAGSTAALTSLAALVAGWVGVDLSAEDAAILIGGLTSLASLVLTR